MEQRHRSSEKQAMIVTHRGTSSICTSSDSEANDSKAVIAAVPVKQRQGAITVSKARERDGKTVIEREACREEC